MANSSTLRNPAEPVPGAKAGVAGARDRAWWWSYGLVVAATGLVRLWAAQGELWLDEKISLEQLQPLRHGWQVFTAIHTDNNHYLNSLWLYICGPGQPAWLYRLPSVLGGVVLVAVGGLIGRRHSRAHGLMLMAVLGASPSLVNAASEARGYGTMLAMVLLGLWLLERYQRWPSKRVMVGLWLTGSVGLLAHLSFGFAWAGLMCWASWNWFMRLGWRKTVGQLAWANVGVVVVLAWLWHVDLNRLRFLDGPHLGFWTVLGRALGASVGIGDGRLVIRAGAVGGLAAVAWGLWRALRRGEGQAWLLIGAALALGAVHLVRPIEVWLVRYLLVLMTLWLLLLALALGDMWRGGRRGRLVAGLVLMGLLGGSLYQDLRLVRFGKGQYVRAMIDISHRTQVKAVTWVVFGETYRALRLTQNLPLEKLGTSIGTTDFEDQHWIDMPEWLVWAATEEYGAPLDWEMMNGVRFVADSDYPSTAFSGEWWRVYHNVAFPPPRPLKADPWRGIQVPQKELNGPTSQPPASEVERVGPG